MQFFADEDDVPLLLKRFNEDPELAFIVRDNPVPVYTRSSLDRGDDEQEDVHSKTAMAIRCKAVKQVQKLTDGDHRLWHVAGQSLSLEREGIGPNDDPWAGWIDLVEDRPRACRLGAAAPSSVIHLQLWSRHRPYSEEELRSLPALVSWWAEGREFLASSHVSWIGNRYAIIGARAHPATVKWWARFQRWMRANARPLKVDRQVTFLAFPSALRRLRSGIAYYANNWNLGPALKSLE